MRVSLTELFGLVGENKGINFYYENLPGIVVTIGFTKEEDIINDESVSDSNDGNSNLH